MNKEFDDIKKEIKSFSQVIPKIEKLEKELELLDQEANGKDVELDEIPKNLEKEIENARAQIKTK